MSVLVSGGNAFDAAVAAGLTGDARLRGRLLMKRLRTRR
jgi:hypothetical protein